jgi:hypothetical protein
VLGEKDGPGDRLFFTDNKAPLLRFDFGIGCALWLSHYQFLLLSLRNLMNHQRISLVLAVLTISFASYSSNTMAAKEKPPENAAVQKSEANSDDELVCRMVKATGSNIKRKVCRTRAQSSADAARSQETMDEMRRSTRSIN